MHLQYILQLVSLRRGEDDAGSQWVESGAGGRYWCSPQSAKKSAMIWDLIVVLGLY
jgi:hypothetical protein